MNFVRNIFKKNKEWWIVEFSKNGITDKVGKFSSRTSAFDYCLSQANRINKTRGCQFQTMEVDSSKGTIRVIIDDDEWCWHYFELKEDNQ